MEQMYLVIVLVGLILLFISIQIYKIINPKPKNNYYKKKRKKHINSNKFSNNQIHIDQTHEYIESIWEEIKKK